MSVIFKGIRIASLADVVVVYSWIQKWRIEPDACIGISPADRPNVVSSGNIVFSTNPSFSDGVKWNEHTRKGLERKGNRTLWVVSGLQNGAMKRYSMTLVHHGQKCSLVSYLLDGDNLPSASFITTPPSPLESRKGLPLASNEPSQATDIYQSTKKPPDLPSSAMERIKSVIEALGVEMGIDMHILLLIILEVFGGKLGNVEPRQLLADCPLSTRETRQPETLDNVLISPVYAAAELPEYGNLPARTNQFAILATPALPVASSPGDVQNSAASHVVSSSLSPVPADQSSNATTNRHNNEGGHQCRQEDNKDEGTTMRTGRQGTRRKRRGALKYASCLHHNSQSYHVATSSGVSGGTTTSQDHVRPNQLDETYAHSGY